MVRWTGNQKMPEFEGQELQPEMELKDVWKNLRDLRDVSEEASLVNLTKYVWENCRSVFFEMSLRQCMRCIHASWMDWFNSLCITMNAIFLWSCIS